MWCPKCKNEYREGFTHCPDCDVDLVESLEDLPVRVTFGDPEAIEEMIAFLRSNGVQSAQSSFDQEEQVSELSVDPSELDETRKILRVFLEEKAKEELEAASQEDDETEEGDAPEVIIEEPEEEAYERPRTYESMQSKAGEYKASAGALILVGVVGVAAVVMLYLDKLPIRLSGGSKALICIVMGFLFALFLMLGFASVSTYKKLLASASTEEELIESIKAYMAENLTKDQVEAALPENGEEMDEEQAYFPRMEFIKETLTKEFSDTDQLLIDKLADDWYTEIY
ncbi:MAG: hypothetical protein K6E84_04255 [Lachnospiraceae bacterium]|nr:hypothetical protein [Lachnospiraceae bacterium]